MGSDTEYSVLLRYTFVLHFIVAIVFGLWLFFLPELFNDFIGWTFDPVNRAYGAVLIGVGMASFLAMREKEWSRVKIVVEMEIVITLFALIGGLWTAFTTLYPVWFIWFYNILMIVFFALFVFSYMKTS